MTFSIVVARYNEKIEWTKNFSNVIIYNKGENNLDCSYHQIFLDNVGREGHTYYKYICDNYDNLPDYVIFLQGRPFDHSPNIISNLHKYIDNIDSLTIDFKFLSKTIITSSLDQQRDTYSECIHIHDTWKRVFGENIEKYNIAKNECIFGAGAQFIVSKKKYFKIRKIFMKIL